MNMFGRTPAVSLDHFATFGDLLKYLRRRADLTQLELSIAVGYSDSMISRLEQNQRLPDLATIKARFIPVLGMEDEPDVARRLLELAATVRQEDAPATGFPPYKGLLHFDENDSDLFFGRETLTAKLIARVKASVERPDRTRFLAVVGASGSGKSSVVRAGLVPALQWQAETAAWPILLLTPTAHPLEALATRLMSEVKSKTAKASMVDELKQDPSAMHRAVQRETERAGVAHALVVVDQFEELFTLCRSEAERQAFVDNLMLAVGFDSLDRMPSAEQGDVEGWSGERSGKWGSPTIVVIALRADFYAHCADYPQLREALSQQQEYIGSMSGEELRRAIEAPAKRGGWELEPGLVEVLLQDLQGEPGALPLLSHALLETWERRRGRTLTISGYSATGGVRGAIAETAEAVFQDQLNPAQRELARHIFLQLTELGRDDSLPDTRRRVALSELISNPDEGADVRQVLTLLADARLITTEWETVEVAHEALIREWPTLREWLAEDREGLRLHRRLTDAAQEWEQSGRNEGELFHGARLDQFESWAAGSSVALTAAEQAFLAASSAARQQRRSEEEARRQRELETAQKLAQTERRRAEEQTKAAQGLRKRAAFLAAALAVAALLAVLAFTFARSANHNAELAAAREVDALTNAELAATRAAEALLSAGLAAARQAEAEAEANLRATAEAIAIEEREAAEWQARLAFSRELVASAILNLEDDPELSILLALQALTQAETLQAQEALHRALHSSHLLHRIPDREDRHFGLPMTISDDGTRLAVGVFAGGFFDFQWQTEVRDAVTLELLYTLPGRVLAHRWDDANRLGTIARDADALTVTIWDAAGQPVSSIALPLNFGPPVVSPDLAWLAYLPVGSATFVLVDLSTGETVRELGALWGAFSPDGRFYAHNFTSVGTPELVVLEVESGREVYNRPTRQPSAVAFSGDGQQIAFAEANGAPVTIVDIASGQDVIALHGHTGQLAFAQFNAEGTRLVTIGRDSLAIIWDTSTGAPLLRLGLDTSGEQPWATFTADDTRLVTSAGSEGLLLWQLAPLGEWLTLPGDCFCGFDFSPDGDLLAVGDLESVRVLTADTGQPVSTLTSPITNPTEFRSEPVFSPDGTLVAAIINGATVAVWDVATGEEWLNLDGHTDVVFGLAMSPVGERLATIAYDRTARLWDLTTGAAVFTFTDVYTSLAPLIVGGQWIDIAFSPDGAKLAIAGGNSVKVWDTATGDELVSLQLPLPDLLAYTVAFSPDGNHLAVGMRYGRGSGVWDADTGEKLFELAGHTASVLALAYSSDGRQIATGSNDGTIRLWDADTGEPKITLQGLAAFLAFSPDDTRLAAQGVDGILRFYALRLEDLIEIASARLTRWWTPEECREYLHVDACPARP